MRSQGFRRILCLDIEVTKNCIRDRVEGGESESGAKILKG